jgi:isoleucyl-tRNA synthetase
MLGNLNNFEKSNMVKYEDMPEYDKYMMVELENVKEKAQKYYDEHNFKEVYKLINNYVTFTLSNFYLDFTKDILYIESVDSKIRKSVQTVLYNVTLTLSKLMAPILPYTSEEVFKRLNEDEKSVHFSLFEERIEYSDKEEVLKLWKKFFEVKDDVYKALEIARNEKVIGKGLEAKVYLNLNNEYSDVLDVLKDDLSRLLIVSKLVISEEDLTEYNVSKVKVEKFGGVRCERCWNYFDEDEMNGDICERCHNVINKK